MNFTKKNQFSQVEIANMQCCISVVYDIYHIYIQQIFVACVVYMFIKNKYTTVCNSTYQSFQPVFFSLKNSQNSPKDIISVVLS